MNNAIYVPAIGEQFNSCWNRKLSYKDYDLKFFTKKSHFDYDTVLQCAYYGLQKDNNGSTYRENIGLDKNKTLIGDSGGFQMLSLPDCKLTPIDSLRWQEENANIMMNLDVPPNFGGGYDYERFKLALKKSVVNFKLFEKERQNYKSKLYNVLHGDNTQLMEMWYNDVKDFNFDGWAVGVNPNSDPIVQAMGVMFLHEKGELDKSNITGTHFFGKSGKHITPTMTYIASKFPKIKVTYDSSSYNIGSIYRTYYMPYDIGPHLSFGEKFKTENPNLENLPCNCPVCKSIDNIDIINGKEIYAGTLISLHNMYQYIEYQRMLNNLISNKDKFMSYIKEIGICDRTFKSFEFIDFCLKEGYYNAIKKYKNDLILQTIEKSKQVGVWNF
jgi:queuine/archaeosine tRNA-ribosyltransferase